ncbi:MAG: hypothetical protein FJ146_09935 [Deltaproteobacteria bacterium]|nr:hypothetical protein [Deltaproteobacteria bacterium]
MSRLILRSMVVAFTLSCGGGKSDSGTGGDSWTAGVADLSGLGVAFSTPSGLESRSSTGTSMTWVSSTGDEGVVLRYQVSLTTATLATVLGDNETLSERATLSAVGAASELIAAAGKGSKRTYEGTAESGKTVTAIVAALPRDSYDQTGFGGVKLLVWGTGGDSATLQARFTAAVASVRFTTFAPSLPTRQYLAIGEWSFAGTASASSGTVGRQLVWLCTGRMAYKQTGLTGNSVLETADGTLISGTWEAYSGAGQPLIYLRLDGQAEPKLMPITVQSESKAFTWGGKQFLGTDRGCELGLPTQLWSGALIAG